MAVSDNAQKLAKQAFAGAKKASQKGGGMLAGATNAGRTQQKYREAHSQTQRSTKSSSNHFQEQLPKLGKRLLGKRFSRVAGILNRFVPDSVVENATNRAFMQLATVAQAWSRLDAPDELKQSAAFVLTGRQELAEKIANENRVLAAIGGGVTGLTGLLGMMADLLWLLLLSLKTIYQTAEAYGKPLTGSEGAKRAFDILAMADLSKLGEKQAVMLGFGAASEVVDDVDVQTLHDVVGASSSISFAQNAIKQVTEQFGIDLNIGFLGKFIPVAAGVTSAAFSVYIINEISATAIAEFESIAGLLENKSLEDKSGA